MDILDTACRRVSRVSRPSVPPPASPDIHDPACRRGSIVRDAAEAPRPRPLPKYSRGAAGASRCSREGAEAPSAPGGPERRRAGQVRSMNVTSMPVARQTVCGRLREGDPLPGCAPRYIAPLPDHLSDDAPLSSLSSQHLGDSPGEVYAGTPAYTSPGLAVRSRYAARRASSSTDAVWHCCHCRLDLAV